MRRLHDVRLAVRYMVGGGIDIGSGDARPRAGVPILRA